MALRAAFCCLSRVECWSGDCIRCYPSRCGLRLRRALAVEEVSEAGRFVREDASLAIQIRREVSWRAVGTFFQAVEFEDPAFLRVREHDSLF